MREIQAVEIQKAIEQLIYEASYVISPDIAKAVEAGI